MSTPRTLVLGSGIVGSAAAWDLSRRGHRVTVADRRSAAVADVSDRFGVAGLRVDVDDGEPVVTETMAFSVLPGALKVVC